MIAFAEGNNAIIDQGINREPQLFHEPWVFDCRLCSFDPFFVISESMESGGQSDGAFPLSRIGK